MPSPRHHLFHFAHSFFSLHCLLTWTLSLSVVMAYKDWFGIFFKAQKERFNIGLQISIICISWQSSSCRSTVWSSNMTWVPSSLPARKAVLGVVLALLLKTPKIWFASLYPLQSHHLWKNPQKTQNTNKTWIWVTAVHKLLLETGKMCFHLGCWSNT